MNELYSVLREKARSYEPWLKALRQDFHTYAEAGWCEIRTTSIIADELQKLGYEVLTGPDVCLAEARMGLPDAAALEAQYERALAQGARQPYAERSRGGFTGAIGILDLGEGPTIAMRFDIDALGVFEESAPTHRPSAEGFRSVNEGVMHACGHDGHAAEGLGVARLLMELREHLHGRFKLIFQPAEEGVRGARSIVEHGHLDDVDYVIGSHMSNRGDTQSDICLVDAPSLATTKLDISYTGKAAHAGATPERGDNALLAAATAVLNIYATPRTSAGDTRVNVGTMHAGSGRNVIPDRAKLEVEVRGSTSAANEHMERYVRRVAEAAAVMHGCTCDIRVAGAAPSMYSDQSMMDRCRRVCTEKLGLRVLDSHGGGGSEDYAYMADRVRAHGGEALFFRIQTPIPGASHSKTFDIREEDLPNGVMTFAALVCDILDL